MANNFAQFNAAFPQQMAGAPAAGGRAYNAAPMTMVPVRGGGFGAPGALGQTAQQLNLKPHEKQLFDTLFYSCEGSRTLGLVSGASIKTLFTQSRLPKQTLAQVWTLADRQKRKVLDIEDFYIACRLIAIAQQNLPVSLQSLKNYLEIPLPQFEGNSAQPAGGLPLMPQMGAAAPLAGIPQQAAPAAQPKKMPPMTAAGGSLGLGATPLMGVSPGVPAASPASFPVSLGRAPSLGGSSPTSVPQDEWTMTDTERAQYVALFSQADADGDGFVGGKEANLFFKQSGLDNATLKQIWLLSDVDRDNRLNPEEFCVAMHLTLRVRKKQPLPAVLPASIDPRVKAAAAAAAAGGAAVGGDSDASGPKKSRLNFDLLPDLLPQVATTPNASPSLGFESAPGGAPKPNSKPGSRRASMDFGFGGGAGSAAAAPQASPQQQQQQQQFAQQPPVLQQQASYGFMGASPMASPPGAALGFAGAPAAVYGAPGAGAPAAPAGYAIIEATQGIEDRTTRLNQLQSATDTVKRSQGVAETRLEEKLKALEALDAQVSAQEKVIEEQKSNLSSLEQQHSETEAKLVERKRKLEEGKELLRTHDSQVKALQESTATMKRETQEADMALALLESQLASLRSSLKGVEDLKENQAQILKARREQHNRLLLEKSEISDLLQASKVELSTMKEQANILRDGLQSQQEAVEEMRSQWKEHQEIVKQEKTNPSPSVPSGGAFSTKKPVTSPPATAAAASITPSTVSHDRKASAAVKAASFNFGDDDAYNIDDITLPSITTRGASQSVVGTAPPAAAIAAPVAAAAITAAPLVAAPTETAPAASVTAVAPPPSHSPAAVTFGEHENDDEWGSPTPPAVGSATSPPSANTAAQVQLPSSSPVAPIAASGPSTPTHKSSNSVSSAVLSPPAPAVPAFPSALQGTGVPPPFDDNENPSADPWDNDDNPFGPSSTDLAGQSNTSPAAASVFGEISNDDPWGAGTTTVAQPGADSANDDPFGSIAPVAAASTTTSAPVAAASDAVAPAAAPAASVASSSAFDDFADPFGSAAAAPAAAPAAAAPVTTPPATSAAAPAGGAAPAASPSNTKHAAASAGFAAAMSEDWAAFD